MEAQVCGEQLIPITISKATVVE